MYLSKVNFLMVWRKSDNKFTFKPSDITFIVFAQGYFIGSCPMTRSTAFKGPFRKHYFFLGGGVSQQILGVSLRGLTESVCQSLRIGRIWAPPLKIGRIWVPPSEEWQNLGTPHVQKYFNSTIICVLWPYFSYFSFFDI